MAITQTGSATVLSDGGNLYTGATGTLSVSVPADATLMVIGLSTYDPSVNLDASGTFDIAGNTSVGVASTAANWRAGLHYIVNPATGTQNLDWQWGGGAGTAIGESEAMFIYAFFKGVDTASPTRASGTNQASGDTVATASLTALSGDLILAMGASYDGANAELTYAWSNGSSLQQGDHDNYCDGAMGTASPTGNQTIGFTATGADEASIAAFVFKASSSGTDLSVGIGSLGEPVVGGSTF